MASPINNCNILNNWIVYECFKRAKSSDLKLIIFIAINYFIVMLEVKINTSRSIITIKF